MKKVNVISYNWNKKISVFPGEYVDVKEAVDLKAKIENLVASNRVEDDDTVFFHSSSKIPRYKFLNYCQDKKARRVIQEAKASKIVVNLEALLVNVQAIFSYQNHFAEILVDDIRNIGFIDFPVALKDGEYVYLNDYYIQHLNRDFKTKIPHKIVTQYVIHEYLKAGFDALSKGIDSILAHQAPLVNDDVLNEQMGQVGMLVNEENFTEFNNMLKAKDASVRSTAVELLANTNYKESTFYISLLLNGNIAAINEVGAKTVNARNFLECFRHIRWQSPPMTFLETLRKELIKNKQLDDIKDEYIHKNALDYVNQQISGTGVYVEEVKFKESPRVHKTLEFEE